MLGYSATQWSFARLLLFSWPDNRGKFLAEGNSGHKEDRGQLRATGMAIALPLAPIYVHEAEIHAVTSYIIDQNTIPISSFCSRDERDLPATLKSVAHKITRALNTLGMDPSSLQTKQVSEFLLGSVLGYEVPQHLLEIEQILLSQCRWKLDEFDRQAHRLATSLGKKALIELDRSEPSPQQAQCEQSRWPRHTRTPRER